VGLTQESLFHGVYHLPQSLNVHPIQEHKNLGETNGLRLSLVVIADEAADDGNEGKDGEAKTNEGEGARKHKKAYSLNHWQAKKGTVLCEVPVSGIPVWESTSVPYSALGQLNRKGREGRKD
jgi:hypothetical protein